MFSVHTTPAEEFKNVTIIDHFECELGENSDKEKLHDYRAVFKILSTHTKREAVAFIFLRLRDGVVWTGSLLQLKLSCAFKFF